jgi:hypothetical protein
MHHRHNPGFTQANMNLINAVAAQLFDHEFGCLVLFKTQLGVGMDLSSYGPNGTHNSANGVRYLHGVSVARLE